MNIAQIEENVKALLTNLVTAEFSSEDFIYELLLAYGFRKSVVTRTRSGERNMASKDNSPHHDEVILKRHLYFKGVDGSELHSAIDEMRQEKLVAANKIRFVIVTNFDQLLAFDTKTQDSLDISLSELPAKFDFFLPWAGMEKAVYQGENPADVKAAEKMAKLFDLIKADNFDDSNKDDTEALHNLNVFLTRLLFCFFAEDTEIFTDNQFSRAIESHTSDDGSDLAEYLDRLFEVLNTSGDMRGELPEYLSDFPYVNGGLFADTIASPTFSAKSRRMLVQCGSELDWSDINPDIFGSMIQAVVHPDQRGGMGMHYTSVTNIMKVIEPLFLNDLYEDLEKVESNANKLQLLQQRLGEIKIFDPACGSGNFLIIAYKELRKLEMEVLKRLQELELEKTGQISQPFSVIKLSQFYGIELDDFAHEVAILSLWLAEHQMNVEFKTEFGAAQPSLPLTQSGNVFAENSLLISWDDVCPSDPDSEIYILGNPPYLGSKNQSQSQKDDIKICLKGISTTKSLDYICCWFIKASFYINKKSAFSFVTTNSICQGTQAPLLWPIVLSNDLEITFAYKSFKWSNNAKNKAGVTCSIIGVRSRSNIQKRLYFQNFKKDVTNISPYLIEGDNTVVLKHPNSICGLPKMQIGNEPYESGHLIFTDTEKEEFINQDSRADNFFKKMVGSSDFIKGTYRWCLWINDEHLEEAKSIPLINERIEKVRNSRSEGGMNARSCMDRPHQFRWVNRAKTSQIVIPLASSERREYIPIGFEDIETIVINTVNVIYDPDPYIFSVLISKIHMNWVRLMGSKLRTDLRYTSGSCYNNYPLPYISDKTKSELLDSTLNIISTRENYPSKTLAKLYDPDIMPEDLRKVHAVNDALVDSIYGLDGTVSDDMRLKTLLGLYERMTGGQNA